MVDGDLFVQKVWKERVVQQGESEIQPMLFDGKRERGNLTAGEMNETGYGDHQRPGDPFDQPHGDKNHSHARKVFNACPANHSSAVVDFKNGVKKSGIIDYKN